MIWSALSTILFVSYLVVPCQVVSDLVRDPDLGGLSKLVWIDLLLFRPLITAAVCVLARRRGMAERQRYALQRAGTDSDACIRGVAGKSLAALIGEA